MKSTILILAGKAKRIYFKRFFNNISKKRPYCRVCHVSIVLIEWACKSDMKLKFTHNKRISPFFHKCFLDSGKLFLPSFRDFFLCKWSTKAIKILYYIRNKRVQLCFRTYRPKRQKVSQFFNLQTFQNYRRTYFGKFIKSTNQLSRCFGTFDPEGSFYSSMKPIFFGCSVNFFISKSFSSICLTF